MIKYLSTINLEEAEVLIKNFQAMVDHSSAVLIVDSSTTKSRITTKSLNDAGYFNITVLTDKKKLEPTLMEAKPYLMVFLDGDIGENEDYRLYLGIKQKNKDIPKTIFLKEEPNDKWSEFYKKGGALGCIGRQFDVTALNFLLNNGKLESELEVGVNVAITQFNDGCIVKLIGDIGANQIVEMADQLVGLRASKTTRCILDCSKVKTINASIEQMLRNLGTEFFKIARVIEIFDPKNKLGKYNLEKAEGIIVV